MAKTILKMTMLAVVALGLSIPAMSATRKSKLKIVSSVPVETRFRQPGEHRTRRLPTKKIERVSRKVRKNPVIGTEITIQAHRREPVVVQEVVREVARPVSHQRVALVSNVRTTKNNLSIEMAGRGGLYSFDYDRQLGRSVSMGLGFSYAALRLQGDDYASLNATLITVPIYGNFYINDDRHHRFMGTGGITIVSAKAEATAEAQLSPEAREMALKFVSDLDLKVNASVVLPLPVGGAGYEYKSSGGFLARAALYVVYAGQVQPWAGFALGSHF